MLPMSRSKHEGEPNPLYVANSAACGEPWWRNKGCNSFSSVIMQGNASDSSSLEQSLDGKLQSEGGISEKDDDTSEQSPIAIPSSLPDRNYRQEDMNLQQVAPTIDPNYGNLMQPARLQQFGHTLGFGAFPYDPYYGGVMTAYGQPSLCASLCNDARMPLVTAQEIVYVNPKQYLGIMLRRQSRAKAEVEKKLINERKPYLHESCHLHAMRRERSSGGRFAKKSNKDASKGTESIGSSGSKPLLSGTCEEKSEEGSNSRHWGDLQSYHKLAMH